MITTCNSLTANKIVTVSENKRKFTILNSSSLQINKVEVDGCYITSGSKCDYLFEIINKKDITDVYYVELKGKNIEHAIKQLEATIIYCKPIHKDIKKECYIVASRVPKSSTSAQNFKKEFKRKHNIQLFIDTTVKKVAI